MSTAWTTPAADGPDPDDGPAVEVTPSTTATYLDIRDGEGQMLGVISHPRPRAPWWMYAIDADLEADLAACDLPSNPQGGRRFTSRKAAVEWLRQRASKET